MDDLDRAREAFPRGSRIVARVTRVPQAGVIGIFLDAGSPPEGFVDVLNLPIDSTKWPRVGQQSRFEVLQHRFGQMRLWPLDPRWRGGLGRFSVDDQHWAEITSAFTVGSRMPAQVTEVFTANRECCVDLGLTSAVAEWSAHRPSEGAIEQVEVTGLSASLRQVWVALVD